MFGSKGNFGIEIVQIMYDESLGGSRQDGAAKLTFAMVGNYNVLETIEQGLWERLR